MADPTGPSASDRRPPTGSTRRRSPTDPPDTAPCAVTTTADTTVDRDRGIVTGAKVFASDFRPCDLGWESECAHALLLRSSYTDRPCKRLLDGTPKELRPARLVTAADLEDAGYRNFISDANVELLLPLGKVADYVGQPVALAVYRDFMRFRRAAQDLREDGGPVSYGRRYRRPADLTPAEELEQWTRLKLTGHNDPQIHYLHDADAPGGGYSQWTRGKITYDGTGFVRGKERDRDADALFAALKSEFENGHGPQIETTTFTQQVDPAFLEPEAGLAWLDREHATLRMLLGTQSPHGDEDEIRRILGIPNATIADLQLKASDCGGSFGGRDKSPFALYLALAAVVWNTPVRLAFDRREQFQGGLKRHASAVRSWIRLDADKRLVARSFVVLRGGVEINLNRAVLGLAALHATGPYRVARAGVHGTVLQRPIPTVGSMRGFGIPQVAFNIETAIDRLAVLELGVDPIELRLESVLRTQDGGAADDLAGTPLRFHVATGDICEAALNHPLWTGHPRRDRKSDEPVWRDDGTLYGVGFACCMEAYGTSDDSVYCALRVTPEGHVEVWSETSEVGQGARRSLEAVTRACLGAEVPVKLHLGAVDCFEAFADALNNRGDHAAKSISTGHCASAASKTAFFHTHVLREACSALLRLRLLPAARTLLDAPAVTDEQLLEAWSDGALRLPGRDPVPLVELAAEVHRLGRPPGVMVHGYFCDGWSSATFRCGDVTLDAHIDAIGFAGSPSTPVVPLVPDGPLRPPCGATHPNKPPRSLYAAGAHLVAVQIEPDHGRIRVVDAVTFLDAGDLIVPAVVDGQVEGGLAMGIAHTLFEELPSETGRDPFVNFDRYRLPRWDDLRDVRRQTVYMPLPASGVLGSGQPEARHKGIGEVTMTTVAPAIANAIAHAVGHTDDTCWPTRTPIRLTDLHLPVR